MKLTNKFRLPEPLVSAVRQQFYSKGEADFSVTELLRPPRIAALERQYADHIEEDASDRIWALMGQAIHSVLERAGIPERRFVMTIDGVTISGKPDRFKDGILQDWKFVTAWKAKDGRLPDEYVQQLNLYAELMRHSGYAVKTLEAVLILRDWSKLEAMRNPDYPRTQVATRVAPLWPQKTAQDFLRERIRLHKSARAKLPPCSSEERWQKPEVWAVMKKRRKSAVRLLNNEAAARVYMALTADPQNHYIVHRPGQNVRCESYCPVSRFCEQFDWLSRLDRRKNEAREESESKV